MVIFEEEDGGVGNCGLPSTWPQVVIFVDYSTSACQLFPTVNVKVLLQIHSVYFKDVWGEGQSWTVCCEFETVNATLNQNKINVFSIPCQAEPGEVLSQVMTHESLVAYCTD